MPPIKTVDYVHNFGQIVSPALLKPLVILVAAGIIFLHPDAISAKMQWTVV
jgi:hypothetical protein